MGKTSLWPFGRSKTNAEEEVAAAVHEPAAPDGSDFRAVLVNAWINTRMERDKSLLTVSSAGIGLLVTLLKVFDSPGAAQVIFYSIAFVAFAVAIVSAILTFGRNATYIERLITDEEARESDKVLAVLDFTLVGSFFMGLASFIVVGAMTLFSPTQQPSSSVLNHERQEQQAFPDDSIQRLIRPDPELEQSQPTSSEQPEPTQSE